MIKLTPPPEELMGTGWFDYIYQLVEYLGVKEEEKGQEAYPIGSVYMTVDGSVKPNELLGGVWESMGNDGVAYAWKRTG